MQLLYGDLSQRIHIALFKSVLERNPALMLLQRERLSVCNIASSTSEFLLAAEMMIRVLCLARKAAICVVEDEERSIGHVARGRSL